MEASDVIIGTITVSIDSNKGLGHPRLWPDKEQFISNFLDSLQKKLIEENLTPVTFDVVSTKKGCVKITLDVSVSAKALKALKGKMPIIALISGIIASGEISPSPNTDCTASVVHFAERRLLSRIVMEGDTLLAISVEMNPKGVTPNQVMMAIYETNRHSFYQDNINALSEGGCLSLPTSPKYHHKHIADNFVQEHNNRWPGL